MPAQRHTRKAKTPKLRRMFQHIRDSAEERGDDPGTAIRKASGVLKRQGRRSRRSRRED
jgi:hypothetical protein